MLMTKLKIATVVLLMLGFVTAGGGMLSYSGREVERPVRLRMCKPTNKGNRTIKETRTKSMLSKNKSPSRKQLLRSPSIRWPLSSRHSPKLKRFSARP